MARVGHFHLRESSKNEHKEKKSGWSGFGAAPFSGQLPGPRSARSVVRAKLADRLCGSNSRTPSTLLASISASRLPTAASTACSVIASEYQCQLGSQGQGTPHRHPLLCLGEASWIPVWLEVRKSEGLSEDTSPQGTSFLLPAPAHGGAGRRTPLELDQLLFGFGIS